MLFLLAMAVAIVVCSVVGRWWAVFVPPLIPAGALIVASANGSHDDGEGTGTAILVFACFAAVVLTTVGVALRRLQRWVRASS